MTEENKKPSEEMTEDVNAADTQAEASVDSEATETPENKDNAKENADKRRCQIIECHHITAITH